MSLMRLSSRYSFSRLGRFLKVSLYTPEIPFLERWSCSRSHRSWKEFSSILHGDRRSRTASKIF